ncbi:hypothetical protein COM05_14370 [Bacillus toyonensis]|uniref:hypothetical protein n=1 Tax=Bacillus toyonensis TaxID=155322 RepID=UPI000884F5D6|nr:hypothetical protein [Bacillus toyonensis]KAB2387537.1 hypothetical protein F8507_05970 [Bacillus toyonensis]PGB83760.1 hypothetical protein COM05_14370 [Bacillus toyonensis]SDL19286.1 hypothetical protein SAMN04487922_12355 [Bacillus toyonensis]
MKKYVLEPLTSLELNEIFDTHAIQVIDYFMRKAMFAQPECMPGQSPLPIQIPKEHIEQWVVQAIGASPVGAGSYAVDVLKEGEFGADVKMLSCKLTKQNKLANSQSGETSLAQKFKDTGDSLDQLFSQKQYEKILTDWTSIVQKKLQKVITEKKVPNIYYFFILRAGINFYLCGLKVHMDRLNNVSVQDATKDSIFIKDYIAEKYGAVKIYKAKKRLELRLYPKQWVDDKLIIEFTMGNKSNNTKIRDLFINEEISEYRKKSIKDIFTIC